MTTAASSLSSRLSLVDEAGSVEAVIEVIEDCLQICNGLIAKSEHVFAWIHYFPNY